jgi:hypothetical protein
MSVCWDQKSTSSRAHFRGMRAPLSKTSRHSIDINSLTRLSTRSHPHRVSLGGIAHLPHSLNSLTHSPTRSLAHLLRISRWYRSLTHSKTKSRTLTHSPTRSLAHLLCISRWYRSHHHFQDTQQCLIQHQDALACSSSTRTREQ